MYWTKYLVKSSIDGEEVLLFNTLTGAVDILPCSFLDKQPENLSPDILQKLIDRGYVFKDKSEENLLFQKIINKQNKQFTGFIACPTFSCNLACSYCFEGNLTKRKDSMTEEMVTDIYNAVKELKKGKDKCHLALFGGEPLLRKNERLVESFISTSRNLSLPLFIISNGTQLDYYKDLITKNLDTVKSVQVTIDGNREFNDKRRVFASGKGTFDLIMSNISLLCDQDIKIAIRINIDKYNINSLDGLADFIIEKGWHENKNMLFNLAFLVNKGKEATYSQLNEEQLLEMFNEKLRKNPKLSIFSIYKIKRFLGYLSDVFEQKESNTGPRAYYCEACYGGSYVFAPDGFIYPCIESMGREEMQIGRFTPKLELFKSRDEWINRTVLNIKECRDCNIALICGGGCAFEAAKKHGTPLMPECECESVKEVVETFMAKKAKELSATKV